MPAHPTVQPHTTAEQLDRALADLNARREAYSKLSLASRIELVDSCIEGVSHVARPWVDVACRAKGIAAGSPLQAEEIFAGPVATLRYLILLRQSLCDIQQQGKPALPAAPCLGTDQRVYVPVVPARGLYDRLAFPGFRVTVRMQPDVTLENLSDHIATYYQSLTRGPASIALVLGAGNVSSIPPTDTFSKLFQEGSLVLLKMNPVNAYLGPLFEQAFSQLIQNGYLRLVYGGAEVGATAVAHPLVDAVHITGSVDSHERIVWGPPGKDTEKRRRSGQPLLKKSITSELGNVSPWIVVPGKYSQRQLAFQARNVAASVTNNASFNCVATKVLLSWREWPDRQRFLDLLQQTLQETPRRVAYYPGARQRFERFTGTTVVPEDDQTLPWTLLGDVQPAESPHLLQEESFACVFAEVALDAATPQTFLQHAVDYANEKLFGTLSATVTVPQTFRRGSNQVLLDDCVRRLKYGTIGINQWPGIAYALMSPPWGGYPGSTLQDIQSGSGFVHNTFMLSQAEKTILTGPLTVVPQPPWFAGHTQAHHVAWNLLRLYEQPSLGKLLPLLWSAVGV